MFLICFESFKILIYFIDSTLGEAENPKRCNKYFGLTIAYKMIYIDIHTKILRQKNYEIKIHRDFIPN